MRFLLFLLALLTALPLPAQAADPCSVIRLRHAAVEAGLDFKHDPGRTPARHLPESMGAGVAWMDYDGDGWLDLYVVQSGPFPPDGSAGAANRLFRNLGNGRFEDVTARTGAGDRGYGQGVTVADV
ncbi:MAG: FG-GAP repeat domain-containing protein, partial [Thermoanaerobaculia bacterium]